MGNWHFLNVFSSSSVSALCNRSKAVTSDNFHSYQHQVTEKCRLAKEQLLIDAITEVKTGTNYSRCVNVPQYNFERSKK